jgi:VanZ family protein
VTLVSIGMGATFASLTATFPQVIWLTSHKDVLFVITGILLVFSFIMMKRAELEPCPIEPNLREACTRSRKLTKILLYFSLTMYVVGLLFSFVIPRILYGM